jgi:hypothetical protein
MVMSMANRYGRLVLCTEWTPGVAVAVEETLKLFAVHQVRWFSTGSSSTVAGSANQARKPAEAASVLQTQGLLDPKLLADHENLSRLVKPFRFQRVMTPRR